MIVTFQIFERYNNLLLFTKSNCIFGLLFICIFLNQKFPNIILIKIFTIVLILLFFAFILTKSFRKSVLGGTFNGNLVFTEKEIIINSKKINVSEIDTIYLRMNDYEGLQKSYRITQNQSNGTNNLLVLSLKNKEKINLFFKIDFQEQHLEIKPFINTLVLQNIISKEKGFDFLNISPILG